MKKLLFLCAVFFALVFKSQEIEPLKYEEVIKVSDSSKSEKQLYANAKIWFTQVFKNPKEVIILDDTENNILIARGNIPYISKIGFGSACRKGYITFEMQIAIKKGRYKYNFKDFYHKGDCYDLGTITNEEFLSTMKGAFAGGPLNYKIKVTNELRDKVKTHIEPIILLLKLEMDKKLATKEDW